jgi:hypothetical protein
MIFISVIEFAINGIPSMFITYFMCLMLFMTFDVHFLRVDIWDTRNNYTRVPLIWLQDSSFLHVYPFALFLLQLQGFIMTSVNFFPFWNAAMASGCSVRMVLATMMTACWATNVGV